MDALGMVESYLYEQIQDSQAHTKMPEGLPAIKENLLAHLDDLVSLAVIPVSLTPLFDDIKLTLNTRGVLISFPDALVNYFEYLVQVNPLAYFYLRNLYLQGSLDV